MRKTPLRRRVLAAAAALSIAFAAGTAYWPRPLLTVSASLSSEKDSLESQKDKIEQELAEIEQQLEATKNSIAQQEAYQDSLDQQISLNLQKMSVLEQEMTTLSAQMDETQQHLDETEADILAKEEEIAATADQYKERMRANYMASGTSTLEMLFSAESFSDFLTSIEMMRAISRHDTALLEQLRVQQAGLENERSQAERVKADLADQQAQAEVSRQEMEETNKQLEAAYQESLTATQNLELEQANFEANKEQRLKEAEEIDQEIEELMRQIAAQNAQNAAQGGGIVTEAGFLWPLPGYSNINSPYGWRFNNTDFHTGMDIGGSGVYGADIVAAKSGVVASPMTHWSYGNNVVINHGDGYVTLYAHCSALLVSPGQVVNQGQVIARVGATGNVTGPHLHFEVYLNGVRQNPANFISYY